MERVPLSVYARKSLMWDFFAFFARTTFSVFFFAGSQGSLFSDKGNEGDES